MFCFWITIIISIFLRPLFVVRFYVPPQQGVWSILLPNLGSIELKRNRSRSDKHRITICLYDLLLLRALVTKPSQQSHDIDYTTAISFVVCEQPPISRQCRPGLAITRDIVFKCSTLFEDVNLSPDDKISMEQSVNRLENEKQIYRLLSLHPHPHLLQGILCAPEGIFMPGLGTTLTIRLCSETSPGLQERWIRQLVDAAAWLEKLGYAHGDLRPQNILLDQSDNIVVADFDATVRIGAELQLATLPFCKVDEDFEPPPAGAESEQFSLGSWIYNIRFGFPPFSDLGLESPVWRQRLVRKEFPSTSNDLYGPIIEGCWHGVFPSISALQTEILRISDPRSISEVQSISKRTTSWLCSWFLLAQCQEFVAEQRLRLAGSLARKIRLRYQLVLWSVARFGLSVICGGESSTA